MTYTNAARDAAVNAIRALLTSNIGYISLHTADPGTTGANEATGTGYARGSSTFPAASGGTGSTGTQASVTARTGTATAATHVGIWTASSAGTFITGIPLSVTENFSTAGGTLNYTPTLTATG
jgi:hypothetical protein